MAVDGAVRKNIHDDDGSSSSILGTMDLLFK